MIPPIRKEEAHINPPHLQRLMYNPGYYHPDEDGLRYVASEVYKRLARGLHLNLETKEEMVERLTEDRLEKGNVVS